jgi:hypothetical protein
LCIYIFQHKLSCFITPAQQSIPAGRSGNITKVTSKKYCCRLKQESILKHIVFLHMAPPRLVDGLFQNFSCTTAALYSQGNSLGNYMLTDSSLENFLGTYRESSLEPPVLWRSASTIRTLTTILWHSHTCRPQATFYGRANG